MSKAAIIGSEKLWAGGHPPGHPLRPERLRHTWEMLNAYGALNAPHVRVESPRMVTKSELAMFHTTSYIDIVHRLSQGETNIEARRFGFGPGDNPVFKGMFESEGLKVGAALVGADLLLAGEVQVAFSFGGGLHHAAKNFASGFCIFGDGAIAIHQMLQAGRRVAYIDIDAHHGDGVQNAFYDTDQVLTISFHESGRYLFPGTGFVNELGKDAGNGYSVNVPLSPYTDDNLFAQTFDQIVPPLIDRFAPDFVVAQLGVDAHWRDPLTHLSLTTHGFEALFQRIHQLGLPWLAVGGGGYDADVVPRAWTLAWAVMSDQTLADKLPPAIAGQYQPPHLHDTVSAPISDSQRHHALIEAEAVVAALKKALDF